MVIPAKSGHNSLKLGLIPGPHPPPRRVAIRRLSRNRSIIRSGLRRLRWHRPRPRWSRSPLPPSAPSGPVVAATPSSVFQNPNQYLPPGLQAISTTSILIPPRKAASCAAGLWPRSNNFKRLAVAGAPRAATSSVVRASPWVFVALMIEGPLDEGPRDLSMGKLAGGASNNPTPTNAGRAFRA